MPQVRQWVIVELSYRGEKETPSDLEILLKQELSDDVDIFVPALTYSRKDHDVTICLMEGYVFVEAALPTSTYFMLEDCPYVRRVLTRDESRGRYVRLVSDAEVDQLRKQLNKKAFRDLEVGDQVMVVEGPHSDLTGEIVDLRPDDAKAYVSIKELQSIKTCVELPYPFLRKM